MSRGLLRQVCRLAALGRDPEVPFVRNTRHISEKQRVGTALNMQY